MAASYFNYNEKKKTNKQKNSKPMELFASVLDPH